MRQCEQGRQLEVERGRQCRKYICGCNLWRFKGEKERQQDGSRQVERKTDRICRQEYIYTQAVYACMENTWI